MNGHPPAHAIPGRQAGPEVIPPGQPSPIYPESSGEFPMTYPGGVGPNGSYGADCEDGACEAGCF
ncbi:MAG TPA: hypothetical protein PK777_14585, partial [Thermoguttaceae bacterium]|nr:hypothetical protein [Thermoguttaceae bacterium]